MSSNSPSSAARRRDKASMPQELAGTGIENDDVREDAEDDEKLVCKLEKLGLFMDEVDRNIVSALAIRCKKLIGLLSGWPVRSPSTVDDVVEVDALGASGRRNESKRNICNTSNKKREWKN